MKKYLIIGFLLLSNSFAQASSLKLKTSQDLVGLKMTSVNLDSTIEFKKDGFIETSAESSNTCVGKYELSKKLLDERAKKGRLFLVIKDRQCTGKLSSVDSQNLISYYIDIVLNIKLDVEIPVVMGGLVQKMDDGSIERADSLEGTGDMDGITFSM